MKALVRFTFSCLAVVSVLAGAPAKGRAQSASSYIIADAASGKVLEAVDAKRKLQVGSLTKIATAMVVLDWAETSKHDLGELAAVPPSIAAIPSVNPMNLQPGDRLSLKDLLYSALLQSDNFTAQTLAEYVGRNLSNSTGNANPADLFVAQMNALARKLRMEHTLFLNPHGLDSTERKRPYSTAEDLARLTRYALGKTAFQFFVMQKDRQVTIFHEGSEQSQYLLHNTNELLGTDGVDGVKTGKTERAGECLIVSARRTPEARQEGAASVVTPRRIIVVLLGASDRFSVARQLLSHGWALYDRWAEAGRPLKGAQFL